MDLVPWNISNKQLEHPILTYTCNSESLHVFMKTVFRLIMFSTNSSYNYIKIKGMEHLTRLHYTQVNLSILSLIRTIQFN